MELWAVLGFATTIAATFGGLSWLAASQRGDIRMLKRDKKDLDARLVRARESIDSLEREIKVIENENERLTNAILGDDVPDTPDSRAALIAEFRAQSERLRMVSEEDDSGGGSELPDDSTGTEARDNSGAITVLK